MSSFLTYLISGLAVGCTYALVASGLVVIHRVTGVVNFAQGTFAVVGGLTAASLVGNGVAAPLAILAAVLLAGVVGILVGLVSFTKPGITPLNSLIITLALAIFAYAVEIVIWGDQPFSYKLVGGSVELLGAYIQKQYLLVVAVTLLTFVLLAFFFSKTYLGKVFTACAANPYAARLSGVNVTRVGLWAFGLGGLLGGLAGVLITPLQPIMFDSDVPLAINGFAAAIFGGILRPGLALLGGLVLGVSQALVAGYWEASYQTIAALVIMLMMMIWQSSKRLTITEEIA